MGLHAPVERAVEAAYAEIVSDFDIPGTEGDITGLSITIPAGDRPVVVAVYALVQKRNIVLGTPAAGSIALYITDSANTKLQSALGTYTASEIGTLGMRVRLAASASARTVKVRGLTTSTGGRVYCSSPSVASIQAVEC